MNERTPTRRRFTLAAGAVAIAGLAGCTGDENGEEDPEEENGEEDPDEENGAGDEIEIEEDEPELIITLENEDGEPVSTGVQIAVEEVDGVTTYNISEEIEDGQAVVDGLNEGDLLITVESIEDEFEPQEEETTFSGEEDEEVSFVLEGATGDDEAGEEGEDEAGEEDEEDEDEEDEDEEGEDEEGEDEEGEDDEDDE
ncbi:MAG: hypothetical protein QXG03_10795 [Halalkalicoccus sp.]